MKSTKVMIGIIMLVLVAVAQVAYLMTGYKDDKAAIAANNEEIRTTQRRLDQLEERVNQLPETKKELELITAEKMAMLNTIPTFLSGSKEGIELMRYMNVNDFMSTGFKVTGNEEVAVTTTNENGEVVQLAATDEDAIVKRSYELTFVGRYEEVQNFIDNLNRSYQIINIESLVLDNAVQDKESEENWPYLFYYGEDFHKIVEATIQLTMFTRRAQSEEEEIYQPDLNMRTNLDGVFSLVQKSDTEVSPRLDNEEEREDETAPEPTITPVINEDLFTLMVGDILTSGDTYKFGGPGEGIEGYVGLISETNVDITLVVKKDGYTMKIKDADGQEDETTVSWPMNKPELNIISTMRSITEVMPSVHVYVDNQTDQVMTIGLTGSLTENIIVYNEKDEQVSKGQTKGNIKLT